MNVTSGSLMIATGALHLLAIGFFGLDPLIALLQSGYVGQVEAVPLQMAVFWSACLGTMMILLGGLMHNVEQLEARLPAWLGWAFVGFAVAGIAGIPVSGFWLLLPQGAWIIAKARTSDGHGW